MSANFTQCSFRLSPRSLGHFAGAFLASLVLAACSSPGADIRTGDDPAPAALPSPRLDDDSRSVSKAGFVDERDDWQALGAIDSWRLDGSEASFSLAGGRTVRIGFPADNIYRLRFNPDNDYAGDHSWAIVRHTLAPSAVTATETADAVELATPALTLRINKGAFSLTVLQGGKVIARDTAPISTSGTRVLARRSIEPGDRFYGLGEKAGPLMKNGQSLKMWNTDAYGWGRSSDPLYVSVPFLVNAGAASTWGLFFDNTRQSYFNLGRERKDEFYFGATGGNLDYWFIAGGDLPAVVRDYTALTGRAALGPAWSLGYQQSRYSYMSQKEVLDLAGTFRKKEIPADAIYLDIDFMDGYRDFTWNAATFPDPAAMISQLHRLGFKAITIIDPGIKQEPGYGPFDSGMAEDVFVRNPDGSLFTGKVWPGLCVFPDFTKPATRAWWGRQYEPLLDLGMDAIWNDMNEPAVFDVPGGTMSFQALFEDGGARSPHAKIHNVYGMDMARATRDGLESLRPDRRPYVLSRAGYAGGQRNAVFWTGDNGATWDHLRLNLTMVINLGLSGMPFSGADVGGYKGTGSAELFARWMELGSLMPFFRNHTEKGNAPHEPWAFGPEAEQAAKGAIERRYRLMPYLYSLARQASLDGSPLVRPLFWDYPKDDAAYRSEDQFMLGEALMAAPVLTEGAMGRSVHFPGGTTWYDWDSGRGYAGGQDETVAAPLDALPLYAHAGSIVPTHRSELWVGQDGANPTTFRIWPLERNGEATFRLYRDNGIDMAYTAGDWQETTIRLGRQGGLHVVSVEPGHQATRWREGADHALVCLRLDAPPIRVTLNGKVVLVGTVETAAAGDRSWLPTEPAGQASWDPASHCLTVRVPTADQASRLEIQG